MFSFVWMCVCIHSWLLLIQRAVILSHSFNPSTVSSATHMRQSTLNCLKFLSQWGGERLHKITIVSHSKKGPLVVGRQNGTGREGQGPGERERKKRQFGREQNCNVPSLRKKRQKKNPKMCCYWAKKETFHSIACCKLTWNLSLDSKLLLMTQTTVTGVYFVCISCSCMPATRSRHRG